MRYQVPQFIEVEDKIFGPFTFRQFAYLLGGAGLCFLAYKLTPMIIAVPIMLGAAGIALALAFYKINNRPLISVLEAAFKYMLTNRLYIWKKHDKYPKKSAADTALNTDYHTLRVPKISDSKLKDLAWSLDINETIFSKDAKRLSGREELSLRE
jgi:hypothetical protein